MPDGIEWKYSLRIEFLELWIELYHISRTCPELIQKKILFVKISQNFEEMNSVKYCDPRKSKESGCQNSKWINTYRHRKLLRCQ